MSLTKYLRNQGYDLIDGPVRNHKPLQLWKKTLFNEMELCYEHISHAFVSESVITHVVNESVSIDAQKANNYALNIGFSVLEPVLNSMGLGKLDVDSKIGTQGTMSISYDNAVTREIPTGEISDYLSSADLRHRNPSFLRDANKNRIVVISGVIFAKNLITEINTQSSIDVAVVASLNNAADGRVQFDRKSDKKLIMTSGSNVEFPVAVKAHRIDFDKGNYNKLVLVTDKNLFLSYDF